MESVIKDLQENKKKVNAVLDAAIQRQEELHSQTHDEAKKYIIQIQAKNAEALKELESSLKKENDAKEKEMMKKTKKQIKAQKKNGEKHLDELVELLYKSVITVEAE
ncbi:hypothetical protein GPJ56_010599 [Histomonas meleagridis]|uniref:uncharacterized protein n=1 Tax=Histomonas meleagridis TaxID=135588 RepID=UPI00355A2B7B|nr:hypothetical protein GPJ56_010599 [Histomonas meleagridis]KAH0803994.1 hypothetical protein GO595_002824 [Histomonas meleagridis]